MTDAPEDRRLVYSTDGVSLVPEKMPTSRKTSAKSSVPDDGVIRVFREKRRGSSVTVVTGLKEAELHSIGSDLRRRCATGGTAKNGIVELQGDQRDAVTAYFKALGRRVKLAG